MFSMLEMLNPGRWLLYLAAAAAAVAAYSLWTSHQRDIGRAEVRAEWNAAILIQQADALERSRAAAKETVRRIDRQGEAQHAYDQDLARARADAAGAADTAGRLRDDLARLAAASGRSPSDTATSSDREAAGATIHLLADMLREMEPVCRAMAAAADSARISGQNCVRSYEALIP